MRIDVLIENTSHNELLCEHGLSFLIHYHDKMYLLDAGQSGNFIDNAKSLNIDLSKVNKCILSHGHYDHSDGYVRFLDSYPHHKIYHPMTLALLQHLMPKQCHLHQHQVIEQFHLMRLHDCI